MTAQAQPQAPCIPTWRFNWQLIRYRPWAYAVHSLCHILVLASPVFPGLLEKAIFDTATGAAPAALGLSTLIALYVSVELARLALSFGDIYADVTFRYLAGGLLRRNVFASILRRTSDLGLPVSPGDAISRFGYDVDEVSDFPTWFPHMVGYTIVSVGAVIIMARINLTITLVTFVPLVGTLAISRVAWARFLKYYHADRDAAGAVTGFLGEIFGAVQAVKVAGAEGEVTAHLAALNDVRRRAAVRKQIFWRFLDTMYQNSAAFGIGVTLLLAGSAMRAGTFTVGDFALFVYYMWIAAD